MRLREVGLQLGFRTDPLYVKRGHCHPRSEVLGGNLQQEMRNAHTIADVH
ncbi:Uncharacterised protein [Prevotella denticola]|uniref:Uncharacterized protein n=1 Tax=Prevotella denticola TaxID=28129 RepID=A0A379E2J8_9BACT|nr:Uncharacterised protein [Prevotella denticola]